MGAIDAAARMLAPAGTATSVIGGELGRTPFLLTGTATTESVSPPLQAGAFCTLMVGATGIRVTWNENSTSTGQVTVATDLLLPAFSRFDWVADGPTSYVHVESDGGVGTHQAWLWISSPRA